jgi:hypothetical protein
MRDTGCFISMGNGGGSWRNNRPSSHVVIPPTAAAAATTTDPSPPGTDSKGLVDTGEPSIVIVIVIIVTVIIVVIVMLIFHHYPMILFKCVTRTHMRMGTLSVAMISRGRVPLESRGQVSLSVLVCRVHRVPKHLIIHITCSSSP